jgi:hypothetical protein
MNALKHLNRNLDHAVSMLVLSHFCLKTLMDTAWSKSNFSHFFAFQWPKRALAAGTFACVSIAANAQIAPASQKTPHWWVTPGAVSYHFENRDQFNQTHPGLGVEYHFDNTLAVVGGTYKNSNNLWSKYAGVNWTPQALQWGIVKFGATAQVADNYKAARNGKPFAFAAPLIAFEGERFGANLYVIPTIRNVTGAVALQFKFALD